MARSDLLDTPPESRRHIVTSDKRTPLRGHQQSRHGTTVRTLATHSVAMNFLDEVTSRDGGLVAYHFAKRICW